MTGAPVINPDRLDHVLVERLVSDSPDKPDRHPSPHECAQVAHRLLAKGVTRNLISKRLHLSAERLNVLMSTYPPPREWKWPE